MALSDGLHYGCGPGGSLRAKSILWALCMAGLILYVTERPMFSQSGEVLANSDIVSLKSAGLDDGLIIAKIRSAKQTRFDASVEGLKMLKAAGLSDEVIRSVIDSSTSAAAYANSDNPGDLHKPGLYIQAADGDGKAHLILLEHVQSGGSIKGGSAAGSVLKGVGMYAGVTPGMGMGGNGKKLKATFNGQHSPIQIVDRNPTFYIYTQEDTQRFGGDSLSVRDFALLKLKANDKTREILIGKSGSFGMTQDYGVDEKARQNISVHKMKDGIYIVKLIEPLKTGEYAFEHLTDGVFYDFGVAEGRR